MKKPVALTLCIALLSAFIITACGWGSTDSTGKFEYRLQGIWETSSPTSSYYGSLIIESDTITIEGYDQYPYPYYKEDPRRPFVALPREFPLDGYSEKTDDKRGTIYIENVDGVLHEIPYTYEYYNDKTLNRWVEKIAFLFYDPNPDPEKPLPPLTETLIKLPAD